MKLNELIKKINNISDVKEIIENYLINSNKLLLLLKEKRKQYKIKEKEKEILYSTLYDYFKFKYPKNLTANEINIYINKKEEYQKILDELNQLKIDILYLEELIKFYKIYANMLKNYIEISKLEL